MESDPLKDTSAVISAVLETVQWMVYMSAQKHLAQLDPLLEDTM